MKQLFPAVAFSLLCVSCADTVPVDDFQPDRSVAELDDVRSGAPAASAAASDGAARALAASLMLLPVTTGDFGASIEPGRGCTFTSAAGERLLVAAAPLGVTSRPRAVVRLDTGVRPLEAMRDGGYNYLTHGPAFQNRQGLTITVVREDDPAALAVPISGPETPSDTDEEAPAVAQSWPATMTAITEGAEQNYPEGIYSCGE